MWSRWWPIPTKIGMSYCKENNAVNIFDVVKAAAHTHKGSRNLILNNAVNIFDVVKAAANTHNEVMERIM
jgi:hypothetical protein